MAHSLETRKKLSETTRRSMTPERRALNSAFTREQWQEPNSKLRESASSVARRRKISNSMQGQPKPFNMVPSGFSISDGRAYVRLFTGWKRRARVVWVMHNGPIVGRLYVHHIDEDKLNDDITNLALMTPKDHSRHHRST